MKKLLLVLLLGALGAGGYYAYTHPEVLNDLKKLARLRTGADAPKEQHVEQLIDTDIPLLRAEQLQIRNELANLGHHHAYFAPTLTGTNIDQYDMAVSLAYASDDVHPIWSATRDAELARVEKISPNLKVYMVLVKSFEDELYTACAGKPLSNNIESFAQLKLKFNTLYTNSAYTEDAARFNMSLLTAGITQEELDGHRKVNEGIGAFLSANFPPVAETWKTNVVVESKICELIARHTLLASTVANIEKHHVFTAQEVEHATAGNTALASAVAKRAAKAQQAAEAPRNKNSKTAAAPIDPFKVNSIMVSPRAKTAMVNYVMMSPGETVVMRVANAKERVKCVEITPTTVTLECNGATHTVEMIAGSQ